MLIDGTKMRYSKMFIEVFVGVFVDSHKLIFLILLDSPQCAFFKIPKANDISGLKSAVLVHFSYVNFSH